MNRPGAYTLAALTITSALSSQQQTEITGLEGMSLVTLEADFSGGTGGSTLTVLIRTRLGSGGTWREIARFDFTTADTKRCSVPSEAGGVVSMGALAANSILRGFLGTELQAVVSSTGTYTNSTLTVRASVS